MKAHSTQFVVCWFFIIINCCLLVSQKELKRAKHRFLLITKSLGCELDPKNFKQALIIGMINIHRKIICIVIYVTMYYKEECGYDACGQSSNVVHMIEVFMMHCCSFKTKEKKIIYKERYGMTIEE